MITIGLAGIVLLIGLTLFAYKLDDLLNEVKGLKKTVFELESGNISLRRDINMLEKEVFDLAEIVYSHSAEHNND